MQASIEGEDDEGCGIEVIDNNGTEHWIEIKYESSKISHHEQDGYPDDPSQRSDEGNEHVEQARRFAQYYVYCERGYDTVPPEIHPERVDAVRRALQELSDSAFDALFGDLKQQLRSYHDDTERSVPIPADAAGPNSVLYRQHVYLGVDPSETDLTDELATLATVQDIDLDDADTAVSELSEATRSGWKSFTEQVDALAQNRTADASKAVEIGGVSSVYTAFVDGRGAEHIGEPADDPFEREPDILIEIAPIDPGFLDDFRAYFDHYLKCQIRDCFVRMGLHPPEGFRVLGPGRIEAAEQYKRLELYPDFTDPHNQTLLDSN